MRGTKDQRWAAVYGAAYVYQSRTASVYGARRVAEQIADEAIAAEPEEVEPDLGENFCLHLWGAGLALHNNNTGTITHIFRSEAAALARLLLKFAETGEL